MVIANLSLIPFPCNNAGSSHLICSTVLYQSTSIVHAMDWSGRGDPSGFCTSFLLNG